MIGESCSSTCNFKIHSNPTMKSVSDPPPPPNTYIYIHKHKHTHAHTHTFLLLPSCPKQIRRWFGLSIRTLSASRDFLQVDIRNLQYVFSRQENRRAVGANYMMGIYDNDLLEFLKMPSLSVIHGSCNANCEVLFKNNNKLPTLSMPALEFVGSDASPSVNVEVMSLQPSSAIV